MKNKDFGNIPTMVAATGPYRTEYVHRMVELSVSSLESARATLAAKGMDLNQVAPYPPSTIGRMEYRMKLAAHQHYLKYFVTDDSIAEMRVELMARLNGKAPWIVKEKPDAEIRIRDDARKDANFDFDAYVFKLAGKIGKPIKTAVMSGRLWDGCDLAVECQDGEKQAWTTHCIVNRSIYGKWFNQWPTRRVS